MIKTVLNVTMLVTGLLLLGCSSPLAKPDGEALNQQLDEAIESSEEMNRPVAPPPAVTAELLPPLSLGTQQQPPEERFDISVRRMPARDFFLGLVADTPMNMVVHPEVEGQITLELKNVTIGEAMATVRDVLGYEFDVAAGGYRVMPAKLQSRIYRVNYLNISRTGSSHTRVSSGQVSDSVGTDGEARSESVSGSLIETATSSDFWAELKFALGAIIGEGDGRRVVVNPQSGVVVIRALPAEHREVAEFLNTTEGVMQRQVVLEAKILEVSLNDGFQSGINWSALATRGSSTAELTQTSAPLQAGFGGVFGLAVQASKFDGFIELLQTQGDVRVLSSPRVSTVNNQKAVIKVGSDEFFVTGISSTTVTGTTTTTTPEIELTPFFSGIALDVTPQIGPEGDVILHIHPSVSEVVDQTKNITVGGVAQSVPLAFSSVRETDSVVRARSGQIVVLGGLMQDRVADENAKTPGLGDLPVAGNLFRQQRQSNRRSELVILLRPVVVDDNQVWTDQLRAVRSRMGGVEAGGPTGQ